MTDSHSNDAQVKDVILVIREIGQAYREVYGIAKELPEELRSIERLIGKDRHSSVGRKLIKVGTFIIVALPEPIITDVVGSVVVAAGVALDKWKGTAVNDLYEELHKNLQELARLKKDMSSITIS